jgi:hypothetical protein
VGGSTPGSREAADTRISIPLLAPAIGQGVVIAGAGIVLFFAPTVGHDIWGWELTPYNTRFLGAIYLAALVDFVALAALRRWALARVVIPMDFVFMSLILVVSLAYFDRFKWERPVTWAWFAIFVSVPVYTASFLWRMRRSTPASHRPAPGLRLGLIGAALPLAGYGVGLLAAPSAFTGFWPWSIDAFHARVYSAIFLTLALAAAIESRSTTPTALATFGLTCVALGALQPIGLVVVDTDVGKVDWSSSGTWAWITMFAALLTYGLMLSVASVRREDVVRTASTT